MILNELLKESKEIWNEANTNYKPYAVVLMVSGGKDSITAAEVTKTLQIPVDFVLHGNTRTGIQETLDYVRNIANNYAPKYLEADAGDAYINYVLRKGFFGTGPLAHSYAYHLLKHQRFISTISSEIRQRKHKRNILLLNGARLDESENRRNNLTKTMNIDPVVKSNIWVNIIHHWTQKNCNDFLTDQKTFINPVAQKLCRSGECMCGTMQSKADAIEAAFYYPEWGKWLDDIKTQVAALGFNWTWGEKVPKQRKGKINEFQPACTSCNIKFEENIIND